MAFNLALFSNPQHTVVVLTVASLLYSRAWEESIQFARENARSTHIFAPEILDASDYLSDDEIAERVTQFARQVQNAVNILTNKDCLEEAMARFPEPPCSGLVSITVLVYLLFVVIIFQFLVRKELCDVNSPS